MSKTDFTPKLHSFMQKAGISSFKNLSRLAGVSESQILQLRRGNVKQMRLDMLLKLSQALQISLDELIVSFQETYLGNELNINNIAVSQLKKQSSVVNEQELSQTIADLKAEYKILQTQLEQQRETLQQEITISNLQLLESLLLQFPTAAHKASENPELAAIKIVPLVQKPLEKLLQAWGIEAIAPVGSEIPYDPQCHQLLEGLSQPGELVKVRYTGYRQGEKLLYRAKVSKIGNGE